MILQDLSEPVDNCALFRDTADKDFPYVITMCTLREIPNFVERIVSTKFWVIRPKLCGHCAFQQNFHTRILDETVIFYAVAVSLWKGTSLYHSMLRWKLANWRYPVKYYLTKSDYSIEPFSTIVLIYLNDLIYMTGNIPRFSFQVIAKYVNNL